MKASGNSERKSVEPMVPIGATTLRGDIRVSGTEPDKAESADQRPVGSTDRTSQPSQYRGGVPSRIYDWEGDRIVVRDVMIFYDA